MTGSPFLSALSAHGPAPDRADKMGLYGFLIGSWAMDGTVHFDDGRTIKERGEIHAGWVLEGRAIQDVWIFPGAFHGTTLRVYDPALDAWHILWSDPLKQYYPRQMGRARGKDIVQDGTLENGDRTRWRFTAITPDSFHWLGERALAGREDFTLQAEFFAHRIKT